MNQKAQVVVAYLDGRRAKGYVYDFSAMKDRFFLFPEDSAHAQGSQAPQASRGTEILLAHLKALFFVKDFAGNPGYREVTPAGARGHGRKLEVTFKDGEHQTGVTEAYNPQKLGFFMFPADPNSNNDRIFVVNRNVETVKML
jgi:hypothetical protein